MSVTMVTVVHTMTLIGETAPENITVEVKPAERIWVPGEAASYLPRSVPVDVAGDGTYSFAVPAVDDPALVGKNVTYRVIERTKPELRGRQTPLQAVHKIAPTMAQAAGPVSLFDTLVDVPVPGGAESFITAIAEQVELGLDVIPKTAKGQRGGVAALDSVTGKVLDAGGNEVVGDLSINSDDTALASRNVNFEDTAGTENTIVLAVATPTSPHTLRGDAQLRLLIGGYDSVLGDALASAIIHGMHAGIDDASTHGLIVGGSYQQIIASNYSVAIGGTQNTIGAPDTPSNYSAVVVGHSNEVLAYYSVTLAGSTSVVAGEHSAALAARNSSTYGTSSLISGHTNKIGTPALANSGDYTVILGGLYNEAGQTANARYGAIVSGRDHRLDVDGAAVLGGKGARPRMAGSQAWAWGSFAEAGDAQAVRAVIRREHSDSYPLGIYLDGGGRLALPDHTAWTVAVHLVGHCPATGEAAAFHIRVGIKRGDGPASTVLVGSPIIETIGRDNEAWSVTAAADGTNGALNIGAGGETGKTVRWVGTVDITEVVTSE